MDATAQALLKVIEYLVFKDLGLGVLYAGITYFLVYTLVRAYRGGTVSVPAVPAQPGGPVVVPPPVVIPPPGPPVVIQPTPPAPPLQSGKGSWYSQFQGKYSWVDNGDAPNSNALGVPDADQGISFYNRATLGQWFELHAPNGTISIEQQTDIGPSPSTGRTIDISAACAERIGYSPQNFPTDGTFQWRSIPAPASVASLSPVAQAIAYQKTRGNAPLSTAPAGPVIPAAGTPAWITLGRTYVEKLTWGSGPMPTQIVAWLDYVAANFPQEAKYVAALKAAGAKSWFAWCGVYVRCMLAYSGITGPISAAGLQGETTMADWAYVDAWLGWGTKVWAASDGDISNASPQPGDVLIWNAPGIHHVSFYSELEVYTDTFLSLGGDQGKPLRVCEEDILMEYCVAIRRAPTASA